MYELIGDPLRFALFYVQERKLRNLGFQGYFLLFVLVLIYKSKYQLSIVTPKMLMFLKTNPKGLIFMNQRLYAENLGVSITKRYIFGYLINLYSER